MIEDFRVDADLLSPGGEVLGASLKFEETGTSAVAGLRLTILPLPGPRGGRTIVVLPPQAQTGRTQPQVFQKDRELAPLRTNRNASPAVVRVVGILGVTTAITHGRPRSILARAMLSTSGGPFARGPVLGPQSRE